MCKPEASNAEQGEKVCHQGWRFTLHSQGMDAYTELLSEEGKAAIPTDPDSPASPELLPSYRCWDLYHIECVGLERPPSNKSNGIVTIALYSHNNCCICFRPNHLTWIFVIP